ncbi:HAMP domain-containing sensor histidine kinase [Catalinimonas sp. 4WD22]|uniref:sensor histidine kinase n=1 Tax=Catalinimonas locisalis TaxID=3133978 RepID=UPI00310114DE
MDHLDFVNKSLRLRYEALSKFATDINQVKSMEAIGAAIASNIKFVIDAFVLRLSMVSPQGNYTMELFRGECNLYQNHQDQLTPFEHQCFANGVPLSLERKDIENSDALKDSIFSHPKTTHLLVLPTATSVEQKLILFFANKSTYPYNEVDFRFASLISELLTTKISQLLLIKKIAENYKALSEANQQLSQLNEEVRTLNNELEIKVEERTHKLSEAHHELNTLFYRTSHDFRRPLSAMLGLINLMEINPDPQEMPVLTQHLKTSVTELDRMLIKLQTISLTEVDDEAVEMIDFSLLVNSLKDHFEEKFNQYKISFTSHIQLQHPFFTHPMILEAILVNITENSICYCKAQEPYIKLTITEMENKLMIQIEDNGDGVMEQYKDKVFDMYTKTSERSTGNGLGLYIVKKLVEKLKGRVTLESIYKQGTTVSLTLPYPEESDKPEKACSLSTLKMMVR